MITLPRLFHRTIDFATAFARNLHQLRRSGPTLSLLFVALMTTGCTHMRIHVPPPVQPFRPFGTFIADVQSAKPSAYVGQPGFAVESAAAFAEMKAHLLELYSGVTVRNSFVGLDRQIVDCVPIDQQPGLRPPGRPHLTISREAPRSATAARETAGESRLSTKRHSEDITLKAGERDRLGNEMYCQTATIPMQRVTLERMATFRNLAAFLAKNDGEKDPNRPGDDADHYYARGVQFVDSLGGDSWLNVWSPTVNSGQMSLSQQWFVNGDGDAKQTIESGWQVMPSKWNTDNAALFIYHTTANYKDNTGCYNIDCSGFVQIANNIYLGRGFTNYSSIDGTQWGFNLQWKRHTDGNWWLFYKGPGDYIAVGYFPSSMFGEGGLATKATKIAFGGEDTGKPSALEMGSGRKASENWQKAAYQNMIFYIDMNTTSQWSTLDKYESNPDCYTADVHNITGNWGTYIFFGGPKCN